MLFALAPGALVHPTVCPLVDPKPAFFIVFISTFVDPAVFPCDGTFSVHFVGFPASDVSLSIRPDIGSVPVYVVVEKLPLVKRPISEYNLSPSLLFSELKLTIVNCAIFPDLSADSVLLVILPLPFVACAVLMDVDTSSLSFVIFPLSFVNIPINVDQFSLAAGFIIRPLAFVAAIKI